jgi:small subunit ribosomal protein S16
MSLVALSLRPFKSMLDFQGNGYGLTKQSQLFMAVRIRLQRMGRKQRPFYQIVVADSRSPRDGRFVEQLGSYNPMTKPATIDIDRDKAFEWVMKGAQPSDTVRAILRFKGIYYKKHLMRGVSKGAMTLEQADAKYQEWIDAKEAKIAIRVEKTAQEKLEFFSRVSGKAPAKPVPVVEETPVAEVSEEVATDAPEAEAPETTETEAASEE